MMKLDSQNLRPWLLLLLVGTLIPDGLAQHYAHASAGTSSHVLVAQRLTSPNEQTITLEQGLAILKQRYHLKFAYRAGLLNGKTIQASLLNQNLSPEALLEAILVSCNLQFKKITRKQFSIFNSPSESPGMSNVERVFETNIAVSETDQRMKLDVSGTITSQDDGAALPGVSVVLKGTTTGTTSDANGQYALSIPDEGGTLVFSFIGYATQEIVVTSQTTVDVVMATESRTLSEVVVTALGIEKERKALAYSLTEVQGEEFTQARENNIANALTGKIAGVNATGISTGPGGSSRVIIRGNGSLGGANQPLYVINGMPIDNSTPGGSPTMNGITTNVDRGDGISGINPDDIESISVLKGGPAAALYGSRAANGVILITTKKGRIQKGLGVEYNSSYTMDQVAVLPDWQYEYGQGDLGRKPTTQAEAIGWGRRSWGAKIDGEEYIGADGKMHPYSVQKNNIKNFYNTGTNFTNTIAFVGGTEALTYRMSLSDLDAKSILPNSTYNRKTANLNLNGKLGKFRIEGLAQYNLEKAKNRPTAGDALGNPNWTPYMVANTVDMRWFEPGYDANGNEIAWNDADIASNAYFVVNKFRERDTKNRFIGQASIQYNILDNLAVKGTISRDFYNYKFEHVLPTGARYVPLGEYLGIQSDVSETNAMLTATYNTRFGEIVGLNAMIGANRQKYENDELTTRGTQFTIPYFYSPTNLATTSTVPATPRTMINSVFGSLDADYKNVLFLTLTGRQDWFSTLSPENNTIFYPSVGGSFVLSEAVQLPNLIDFAKLRTSWAQVGGGAPNPYQINLSYRMDPSATPIQNVSSATITNSKLKPYTSTTFEAGIDLEFFNRRLGLDFTYYDRKTTDDILTTALSPTSGYNSVVLNIGEMSNKGVEVLLTGTPISSSNFKWNVSYNIAHNKNEVVRLADGLNSIQMAVSVNSWAFINNIVGKPYGAIVGTKIRRDEDGNVVYNPASGLPMATALQPLGNGVPPVTMGLTNEFSYKNFSLNVLIDGKFGNKVFSLMEIYAMRLGLLKATLPGRESGLDLSGVTPEGAAYTRTVPFDQLRPYYDNNKNFTELFLHDGSFVKLRQVIFTYNLPVQKFKLIKLQSASISFVGRNLAILYKKTDNFDPEQSFSNGPAQGFESLGLPRTRNYGVNLMVKF